MMDNNSFMLARSEVRLPLFVLLVLSAVAWLAKAAGLIQSAVYGNLGFSIQRSTASACWQYLTLKLESLNIEIYNIIFFTCCLATFLLTIALVVLVRLLQKYMDSSQEVQFPWWNMATFYLLYILYSFILMEMVPSVGYYLTLIIQKGIKCTSTFSLNWLTIGGVFILSFLCILICWIFLFLLKIKWENKIYGEEVKSNKSIKQWKMPKVIMNEPTMKNMLDLILMQQRLQQSMAEKEQSKEPLLAEVDSEDKDPSEQKQKQKISYVGFEEYKKKQEQLKRRQEQEQEIVRNLIRIQQEKKEQEQMMVQKERQRQIELRKKLSSMALSPDDKDFDKMFQESQSSPQNQEAVSVLIPQQETSRVRSSSQISNHSIISSISQEMFYPADYIPQDQQDQRRFKQYKKRLLEKANIKHHKSSKKHLQNISGGRSKKQLERMINANKRPKRKIEWYQNMLKNNHTPTIQEIQESDSNSQQIDRKSATFNFKEIQPEPQSIRQLPSMIEPQVLDTSRRYEYSDLDDTPRRLLFEKKATRSPIRKKLFEEENKYFHNLSMGSVLGTLVKGVVESTHKTRLTKIREKRESNNPSPSPNARKKEKLIDFIRSKYS